MRLSSSAFSPPPPLLLSSRHCFAAFRHFRQFTAARYLPLIIAACFFRQPRLRSSDIIIFRFTLLLFR